MIFDLDVSDVGVGLIYQSLAISLTVLEGTTIFELSYRTLSITYKSTTGCLAVFSFLTITAISFDHFLAVHLRPNYRGCRDGEKDEGGDYTAVVGSRTNGDDVCT